MSRLALVYWVAWQIIGIKITEYNSKNVIRYEKNDSVKRTRIIIGLLRVESLKSMRFLGINWKYFATKIAKNPNLMLTSVEIDGDVGAHALVIYSGALQWTQS